MSLVGEVVYTSVLKVLTIAIYLFESVSKKYIYHFIYITRSLLKNRIELLMKYNSYFRNKKQMKCFLHFIFQAINYCNIFFTNFGAENLALLFFHYEDFMNQLFIHYIVFQMHVWNNYEKITAAHFRFQLTIFFFIK